MRTRPRNLPQRDNAAVRELYRALIAGWNEGVRARFAAAFIDDGDLVAFDGTHLRGRSIIAAFQQAVFDQWSRERGSPEELTAYVSRTPTLQSCTRPAAPSCAEKPDRRSWLGGSPPHGKELKTIHKLTGSFALDCKVTLNPLFAQPGEDCDAYRALT